MELKGELGQSSVNGLLNNSSSVNPLPLPDIKMIKHYSKREQTLSKEKCSGETTNQGGHCHGYALFPFSASPTWTTP